MPRRLERILAPADDLLSESLLGAHVLNGLESHWPGDRTDTDEIEASRKDLDALDSAARQITEMVAALRAELARVEQLEEVDS